MLPIIEQQLSGAFGEHMKQILSQEEMPSFIASFEQESARALRLNPRKLSEESLLKIYPGKLTPVPWIRGAFYYSTEERPSRTPLYGAGAYYLQDAGAMTPLSRFAIEPGDRVLDLCAAPGGKSTAAGAALCGEGILVANDVSPQRAKALLRNLELFGISNCIVMSEEIETLCERFPQYFDKIILDAPCSGEGMFRKDPSLAEDWTPEKSEALSRLQKKLILQAYEMLSPGGALLYSTCTYERKEDEEVLESLLKAHPDMRLYEAEGFEGFAPGLGEDSLCKVRIYPHRMRAEGHFFACLKKEGPSDKAAKAFPKSLEKGAKGEGSKSGREKRQGGKTSQGKALKGQSPKALVQDFFSEAGILRLGGKEVDFSRLDIRGEKAYLLPEMVRVEGKASLPYLENIPLSGLHFLRCGLYLGDLKKDRFEPSEPLALALLPGDVKAPLSLKVSEEALLRYLRGESIEVAPFMDRKEPEGGNALEKGYRVLCVEDIPLAFGKLVGGVLKNKLPSSWRLPN